MYTSHLPKALLISLPLINVAINFLCVDIARCLTIPACAVKLIAPLDIIHLPAHVTH